VLLRAADLTLERGYRYFLVDTAVLSVPDCLIPGGGSAAPTVCSLIIKVFYELPEVEGSQPYDAASVRRETEERYPYLADAQ
jgi:hypothetical protein